MYKTKTKAKTKAKANANAMYRNQSKSTCKAKAIYKTKAKVKAQTKANAKAKQKQKPMQNITTRAARNIPGKKFPTTPLLKHHNPGGQETAPIQGRVHMTDHATKNITPRKISRTKNGCHIFTKDLYFAISAVQKYI